MTARLLVLFVHVISAALLVGGSMLALPAVVAAARRVPTVQELRTCFAIARPLGPVAQWAGLVLLASGIYLASAGHYWSFPWVQAAAALWVVNAMLAARVHKPAVGRLAAAAFAAPDGPVDARLDALRRSGRWTLGANVLLANNAAILFQMTVKPGLAGAVLAVVVAHAAVLLGQLLAGARKAASQPVVIADA